MMFQRALKELRAAVDEKHRQEHRMIDELEASLTQNNHPALANSPAKNSPVESNRAKIDRACKNTFINVKSISGETGLSEVQIRGVLYDPHYQPRYNSRKMNGEMKKFKLKSKA